MFFTECARLAEQHPDLANVFEQLDSQLRAMGTAEVIRSDDLASFLNIDPNQMRSALDMFAQEGVLRRVEMIECSHCQMAVPRVEYQQALEEDDEYRCTSCDHPLTNRTIQIITAYRSGEKWPEVLDSGGPGNGGLIETSHPDVVPDQEALYPYQRLAEIFNVDKEALRKRLERFREGNLEGWIANTERHSREAKHFYRLGAVRAIIEDLRASSQRPAK
jgi:hypothetical protein